MNWFLSKIITVIICVGTISGLYFLGGYTIEHSAIGYLIGHVLHMESKDTQKYLDRKQNNEASQ